VAPASTLHPRSILYTKTALGGSAPERLK
jgi:hypothetical protein